MAENKFVDRSGVSHLWKKVIAEDYANNETIMAVVDAIDAELEDIKTVPIYKGTGSQSLAANDQSNTASGSNSYAGGYQTTASGSNSYAGGVRTAAEANCSHAEGMDSRATQPSSHAEGYATHADGDGSHSEGHETTASGVASHAEGKSSQATGEGAHAEGQSTLAEGQYSHVEGNKTIASANFSHSEGDNTKASAESSHSEGRYTVASGKAAHAEGGCIRQIYLEGSEGKYKLYENSTTSLMPVWLNGYYLETEESAEVQGQPLKGLTVYNDSYEAVGTITKTYTIEGELYAVIDGITDTLTVDSELIFLLSWSKAEGTGSHSEGGGLAIGSWAHAEGSVTWAANQAHAEGFMSAAMNTGSHAEGIRTRAHGQASHTEGNRNYAQGNASHAEGRENTAIGDFSHAEGQSNIAYGQSSHAEGVSNKVEGDFSHAEGENNVVTGPASHVEGFWNIANGSNQHVQGKYNLADNEEKYAHIVGNGAGDTNRSNAHTLDWNGNAEYAGDVVANGCSGDNPVSLVETYNKLSKVLWEGVFLKGSISFSIPAELLHSNKLTLLIEGSPNKNSFTNIATGDMTALISIACSTTSASEEYIPYYNPSTGIFSVYHFYFANDLFHLGTGTGATIEIQGTPTTQNLICTITINSVGNAFAPNFFIHTISAINIREAD